MQEGDHLPQTCILSGDYLKSPKQEDILMSSVEHSDAGSTSGILSGDEARDSGGPLVSPHPRRRPSMVDGMDVLMDEVAQVCNSGLVVEGVTPNAEISDSVLPDAAKSFKRTGAGREPHEGTRRPPPPGRSNSFSIRGQLGISRNLSEPHSLLNNDENIMQNQHNLQQLSPNNRSQRKEPLQLSQSTLSLREALDQIDFPGAGFAGSGGPAKGGVVLGNDDQQESDFNLVSACQTPQKEDLDASTPQILSA